MNRKALGRGLSALISEDSPKQETSGLLEIDIDLIQPNPEQPRTIFTDTALDELAQSIRANGIVQPIVVRKKGGNYEIVAGERRWRAAQRAGLQKVPSVIKEVSDDKILELALIENIQRQELNAMEEARAYRKLVDTIGLTQETIAERVGKNRTVITTFMRLLKLPDDIQKLIEEEKITAGHGRALLMTEDTDSQRRIARSIMDMSLSVRETEKAVKRIGKDNLQVIGNKQVKPKLDANMQAAETKLRRKFGTQIKIIPDGKGTGGKIEFEYYGESDLDRIYQMLIG
ncbi:MAG: ParB/RepB/Spo0J family partition protein [Pyrinomonadaceae bacterium]|jgi:ParB family chromosome partitioning protein|nr:ParB/RepB/Spo0J family partition protein [Pyrinomonadaceae bacterium]